MRSYIHWLKINGMRSIKDETKQFVEIQRYLDQNPTAKATIYLYEYSLFNRVVKLECNQNWNDLDLAANTGSHSLRRLTQRPNNIGYEQPFSIPERLTKPLQRHKTDHDAR